MKVCGYVKCSNTSVFYIVKYLFHYSSPCQAFFKLNPFRIANNYHINNNNKINYLHSNKAGRKYCRSSKTGIPSVFLTMYRVTQKDVYP